jgi:uncharacterized protein YndB with AHSA1/START domain
VHHATFTLERDLPAAPARVFLAFADKDLKARWFRHPSGEQVVVERSFDFRPGGQERLVGAWPGGRTSDFQCRYYDIVPGERITYVYEMFTNGVKLSVSLATIEVHPRGTGTRLRVTEQGAFLREEGPADAASREEGTAALLDALAASLD